MTEEEHLKLSKLGNEYQNKLSRLIGEVISEFPLEMESIVLAYLQEKTSVYRTQYQAYIKRKGRLNDNQL